MKTLVAIIIICGMSMAGCSQSRQEGMMAVRNCSVELGNPIDRSIGIDWPKDHSLADTAAIEYPVSITVHLPSGRKWIAKSHVTFISKRNGAVSQVDITPLEKATDFPSVVQGLSVALRELDVIDKRVTSQLERWKADAVAWDPFATQTMSCKLDDESELFVKIKPASETGKWFIAYSIYASKFLSADDDIDSASQHCTQIEKPRGKKLRDTL